MNIADIVEQFILGKLSGRKENIIILRRNELADELSCAPSQISYVLNTRFTAQRGFVVESRRGMGGFVRIVRIPIDEVYIESNIHDVSTTMTIKEAMELVEEIRQHEVLTRRETIIIKYFISVAFEQFHPTKRAQILQDILMKISKTSQGGE